MLPTPTPCVSQNFLGLLGAENSVCKFSSWNLTHCFSFSVAAGRSYYRHKLKEEVSATNIGTRGEADIFIEWFIVEQFLQWNVRKPFEYLVGWYKINQLMLRYIWVNRDDAVRDRNSDRP